MKSLILLLLVTVASAQITSKTEKASRIGTGAQGNLQWQTLTSSQWAGITNSSWSTLRNIPAPPSITTNATLPGGTTGTSYSQTLAVSGGTAPFTWMVTVGSLPAGLALSTSGTISGSPSAAGTATFTVQVTDATTAVSSKVFMLTVVASPPTITTTSPLPAGVVGIAYSTTLTAVGGKPPYTWSVSSGSAPTGTSLSSGGVLSGTPTTTSGSPFAFTVTVTDANSLSNSVPFTVTITGTAGTNLGVLVSGICQPMGTGVVLSGTPLSWNGTAWVNGQGIAGKETVANCTY